MHQGLWIFIFLVVHYLHVGSRITITQSHTHAMQQTHTHKAVTGQQSQKRDSRRRQSKYRGFSSDVTAAKSCKSRCSQPPCWIFFALSGIGKSHKICSHSLLLNPHKAKLHRSNNVINIYSLTASLTCSNKISKKLKHIL